MCHVNLFAVYLNTSFMSDCSNAESKKRKKKLGKHKQMKKRKFSEELTAVTQDRAAEQLAATGNI